MLDIAAHVEGTKLSIGLAGRFDAETISQFREEVKPLLEGIESAEIDLADVNYISSAGLREILAIRKRLSDNESMVLCNLSEDMKLIFDTTGLSAYYTFA